MYKANKYVKLIKEQWLTLYNKAPS